MKTKQIVLIMLGAFLLVALFTNPGKDAHKEEVKSKFTESYQKSLEANSTSDNNGFEALGNLLGTSLINTLVENNVSCDNYLLFSITKITYAGNSKSIGFGFLGNVFLSGKVDEALNKNIN
jgi:hypothetical protein